MDYISITALQLSFICISLSPPSISNRELTLAKLYTTERSKKKYNEPHHNV